MESPFHKHLWQIILIGLSLIALLLFVRFIFDIHSLYRAGELRPTRGYRHHLIVPNTASSTIHIE